MENYKGFEITETEDGEFTWSHSGDTFTCIEDAMADIEDYLDCEEEACLESRAEEAMERRLFGEE